MRASTVWRPSGIVMAIAVTVVWIVHARAWTFLCDDAFISFRYARHLAEYGQPIFNVGMEPPERVEGYTNFLWVVALAGLDRSGWSPPEAASVLTQLGAFGGVLAVTVMTRRLRGRFEVSVLGRGLGATDLIPAALLVCIPEYMVWSHGGLETSMAIAVTMGTIAAWMAGHFRSAALGAAVSALLRPDGLLPIAVFGLVWLAVVGVPMVVREPAVARRRIPIRRLLHAALIFMGLMGAHLIWRRSYYGAWLPNTWAIKSHGTLLRDTYGVAYVKAWGDALMLVYAAPLVLGLRPRHLLLVGPIAAVVAYGWWIGGDFMAYGRLYGVATGMSAALVGWIIADAVGWLERRISPWTARSVVVFVGVVACIGLGTHSYRRWQADMAKPTGWIDGRWEGVAAMDRFARVGRAVGEWMHANLPPETLITVGAAGAVPYAAGVRVIDAYGLVDPSIAQLPEVRPARGPRARPGHQIVAPTAYIKRRDPDLLCHVGYRGPRRPTERRAHRAFGRGYRWACIEPAWVSDPRAAGGRLDVGVYCCRRPIGRPVGPWGPELVP